MKPEEEWARRILERALQRPVLSNDDGSQPRMYDLRIGPANAPEVAIECVGAVNKIATETWNIGPGKGSIMLPIKGDWWVGITPNTKIKSIRRYLAPLLQHAEVQDQLTVYVDFNLKWSNTTLYDSLTALGITSAACFRIPGTGKVELIMERPTDTVHTGAETVSQWVSKFLYDNERQDVLLKLQRSGAKKHHVFIPISLYGVPEQLEYYFMRDIEDYLPLDEPDLPPPVTDVWIVSVLFAKQGLHWNGISWERFEARGEGL